MVDKRLITDHTTDSEYRAKLRELAQQRQGTSYQAKLQEIHKQRLEQNEKDPLTLQKFRNAREKMHEAIQRVLELEREQRSPSYTFRTPSQRNDYMARVRDELYQAREEESAAKARYEDLYQRGGPMLEAQERAREFEKKQEQQRAEMQAAHAKEQEEEAKLSFRKRFLAAGGTAAQFEQAWPQLWQEELIRRAKEGQGTIEQRLRASGRYSAW